jgi:acetyltransferase-like isoleucine patch superfamily enzyme
VGKTAALVRRQLTPGIWTTLAGYLRFGCLISPRAEVELGPQFTIGRGSQVSAFVKIKSADGPLKIGARTSFGAGGFIVSGPAGLEIGDDCLISPNVCIIASNYRYDRLDRPIREQGLSSRGIRIGNDVWVGSNSTILDGAEIGSGSIIGPNAVVGSEIPPHSIAQGNPAKVIFQRR